MHITVLYLHFIRNKTTAMTAIIRTEMITKIQTLRKDFLKYQIKKKKTIDLEIVSNETTLNIALGKY